MRLTKRDEYGNADIIALSDEINLYGDLSFSQATALTEAMNKLADYEDKDEPKEVIIKGEYAYCQKCGEPIDYPGNIKIDIQNGYKPICPRCGQRLTETIGFELKWSWEE